MNSYQVVMVYVVEANNEQEAIQQVLKGKYKLWTVKSSERMTPWDAEMEIHYMYPNPEKGLW